MWIRSHIGKGGGGGGGGVLIDKHNCHLMTSIMGYVSYLISTSLRSPPFTYLFLDDSQSIEQ